ncbi:serine-rich adhesin for platelets-like [Anopheles funestus]|uniref:serine-rich adhesin for platelets-like n=1 Tax=Anopheles funestus TaxID=62324 RepID=UPI0020C620E0|nr:serine-rich adhesin for platelets-like [Anopheles funestus]
MDPLEQSRIFLDRFKTTVNPDDPLPVWVPIYNLKYDEIEPAIIDWIRTYLDLFGCPQCILTPIIRKVVEQVLSYCKENPKSCGFTGQEYKPLQLNQEVISRVNQVCTELLDNEKLNNLLAQLTERNSLGEDQPDSVAEISPPRKIHFSRGMKHRRRTMEDRHVCLPEFNKLFCTNDTEPTAFYGVYDGHGGQEAASFAASHLHYYIAQSAHYPHDMQQAFREAFLKTDKLFLEKCENHHLNSGSTAVACVHHISSRRIDLAWVGDSQAILVTRNPGERICKRLVHPVHVASDPNERQRIQEEGGCVIPWNGQYRVSGQLAITRAIGNRYYKPYVTSNPAISLNQCTEDDLLLILASDGLWEGCSEFLTSMFVLYAIRKFPDDPQKVTDYLITFAKDKTRDNITVIIVFLKDPQTIIKETPFIEEIETNAKLRASQKMEINGAASNGFLGENNALSMEDHKTFDDIQNFMAESVMLEPKSASALCVGPMDDMGFLSDGGLGPETDVDGVHDSKQQSPSPLLEEAVKSSDLDNGDIEHEIANIESVEQHTMDHHNPFAQSLNAPLDLPSDVAVSSTNDFEEEDPTSPSSVSAADPVELSEEHLGDAMPHVNGNGEHHYDEPNETEDELLGATENEAAEIVPTLKAELNADEIVPLKSIDEPIVNDLLGGDSIVDNKLIDQLDSFGIPEAIRRQLIEQQQVSGAAMLHEQDEDDDDGQLITEEKHSDFAETDDGAEKEDLHHEKVFDSDYATDHRGADVKQDDDAGCCEDSEEDEWDYVKVNNQQQQQEQESQPAHEKLPESTPSEEITHTFEHSNSFAPDQSDQLLQESDTQRVQELEQHFEREANYKQEVEAPTLSREEEASKEDREVVEYHDETTAVPNTSELVVADILGDNTESTVSECTKEVDDVISGVETKEVVNLLNDFKEDVSLPTTTDQLFETNCLNEENIEPAAPYVPSDSVNMEASMYGGSVAEQQPLSPESPIDNFPAQQQQQQQQQYIHEKDLFGSDMDDTMSPTADGEDLKEKHLYETEEKSMNVQQQDGGGSGDYGWQLNPDAKEFVPVTGSIAGEMNAKLHENIKLRDDAIVSQSPRKGTMSSMEDLDVPAETVFQTEMDKRPHEFEVYGEDNGENTADDSAGEPHLRSPMAVHPFDLTQFSEQTVVEQIQSSNIADITNGEYVSHDSADDVLHTGANSNGAQYATDEMELLNKVQELPMTDEEPLNEVDPEAAHTNGSAKEELYVEHKDTMDVSGGAAEVDDMMYHGYTNPIPSDEVPKSMVSDISQSPEFKMLQSSIEHLTSAKSSESNFDGQEEHESTNLYKESSALQASVYDPEPELVSIQAPTAVEQLASNEQALQASQGCADLLGMSEPVVDPLPSVPTTTVTEEKRDEVVETKVAEVEKASEDVAATVAAATVATVAVAAAAVTATVTSKSTKPKASTTAPATKKPTSSVSAKPSSAASKDSATKTASRVGSSSSTVGAARKTPVGVTDAKKAATTTTAAKTTATSAAMNGVKERPASAASSKPSLAAKKPIGDAAKTATSKTTSATSSVAAARTKVTSATSSSTTKTASASSATRTAASKSVTSSSTTTSAATGKTNSRLSTTATTRTVTSRPSSAVSSASVPSKTTTTTTTTAKRTVAAKSSLTNGTTTTDGTSTKSTKTTTTTTGSTAPRTGTTATRSLAAKPTSTTVAAKKALDVKTTAATKTSSTTASATGKTTTMRTSLAPTKATATSPTVRKLQQNGVPAKKSTTAVSPAPGVKKPAPIQKPQPPKVPAPSEQQAPETTTAVIAETNGTGNNESVDVVQASSPPEQQPADQLLVPIPQAM